MIIKIEARAEQALRHLQPADSKMVNKVLSVLESKTFSEFRSDSNIKKLAIPKEQAFVFRATPKLRILFKYRKDHTLLMEDIASHKGLEKCLDRKNK